jgi:hypothetical protein
VSPADQARDGRTASALGVLLRIASHLVGVVPLFVVVGIQISKGWLPTSDDAVIAWRTWNVFSGPVPLDGQFTQVTAAGGHAAFDPGPLQYFLLAPLERIDPTYGLLWGAAVLVAVLIALGIEAAWSVAGPLGGSCVAILASVITATVVQSSANLAWNPSIGMYALGASIVIGVAVASGRLGWLPVAVGTASLAVQSHLSYVVPCLAVLAVASVLGLLYRRRDRPLAGLRPLIVAVVVALACWIAPGVQQLTGHPGDWSLLLSSLGSHGPGVGLAVGLHGIAAATKLPPSWAERPPAVGTMPRFDRFMHLVFGGSSAWAITALALCVVIAIAAGLTRHRALSGLAGLAAVSGAATAWTIGSVPVTQGLYLGYYLYFALWPVGMAIMATFGATLVTLGREVARRSLPAGAHSSDRPVGTRPVGPQTASSRGGAPGTVVAARLGLLVTLLGGGTALALADVPLGSSGVFLFGWEPVSWVSQAAPRAIALAREHGYGPGSGRGPVTVVTVNNYSVLNSAISQGVGYLLVAHDIPARVTWPAARALGTGLLAQPGAPTIVVRVSLPHGHPLATVSWQPARRVTAETANSGKPGKPGNSSTSTAR